ncbi:hypothetical protein, partial [Pseudomonas lundensis]
DICNQIPGCVGEFIPLCHLGLLALMAVYFTENRISWVYVQSLAVSMRLLDGFFCINNRPRSPLKSVQWRFLACFVDHSEVVYPGLIGHDLGWIIYMT